ncbi:hypothetical protein LTR46_001884 [Exophiala xenobiotica]|nr:hypothetical protein LTR46_001884 [Exophiala xenobiotica]
MFSTQRYTSWLLSLVALASCDYTSEQIGSWDRPRASLIRDYVYLEGGKIQTGGWKDGAWDVTTVTITQGALFNLSLHEAFGVYEDSAPAVFQSIPEAAVNNFYLDGYMFASYDEFYAWGGMTLTSLNTAPRTVNDPLYNLPAGKNDDLGLPNTGYQPQNSNFPTGITNGAGANAPSENLGFYFGGLYNQNGSKYDYFDPPTDEANFLVKVTMDDLTFADWAIINPPDSPTIPWRAEGALVWVPTSSQGILIAIGGVVKPADLNYYIGRDEANTSMTFLKEFPVFDIGSNTWSLQSLSTGSPFPDKPLAQFCTVVASAEDGSHHEIFVYGGWDSNNDTSPNTDVWILTVPSFTWIKADSVGREGDPRQGHVCVSPYPDQMIAIGGTGAAEAPLTTNRTVDVYNLNTLNWTGVYDPNVHDDYKPHQTVLSVVSSTPTASGMPSNIASWFDNKYDMSKIKFFGPYEEQTTSASNPTNSTVPTPAPHHSDRGWVVPVAATVSTVGGLALLGGLFFICCRKRIAERRRQERETSEVGGGGQRKNFIIPWIFSTSAAGKDVGSDTITEVETQTTSPPVQKEPQELEGGGDYFAGRQPRWSSSTAFRSPQAEYIGPVEAQDTAVSVVHEKSAATSPKSELPDGINYEFRNMAMYPPSVVSGGHPNLTAPQSATISQPDSDSEAEHPTSPRTAASHAGSYIGSPRGGGGVPMIPEDAHVHHSRGMSPQSPHEAPMLGALDPVSPLTNKQGHRPSHKRHNSSMSSGVSIPSPGMSPGMDQSSPLPMRPRSLSMEGIADDGEGHVNHTM